MAATPAPRPPSERGQPRHPSAPPGPWRWLAVVTGPEVRGIAGALLVALGLATLRTRTPSHRARRLLPVLVLAALVVAASTFLPLVRYRDAVAPSQVTTVLVSAMIILGCAPITAYCLWVPLGRGSSRSPRALLDPARPRGRDGARGDGGDTDREAGTSPSSRATCCLVLGITQRAAWTVTRGGKPHTP